MITTSGDIFAKTTSKFICFFFALLIASCVEARTSPKSGAPLPSSIIGTWQVTKVNIDTGSSRGFHIRYNDPAEKGRIIIITPEKMSNDGVDWMTCTRPTATVRRLTAAALIKESMGWRWIEPEIPTPTDYELPISDNTVIDTLWINCEKGRFGPGAKDITENTWIAPLPDGRLAMRWFDETVLILTRLPPNVKPDPSFDCAKAETIVEKTICGSLSLASFDRSVTDAYSDAIKFYREIEVEDTQGLRKLKTGQRSWLVKRNACGADEACLKKSMRDRLEALAEH